MRVLRWCVCVQAMYCMQKILENVEYDTPEYKVCVGTGRACT